MKLSTNGLANRNEWEEKGYALPKFEREKVAKATKENPFWIHFGAGNIFRAFQANVVQNLLNEGVLDRGLIVAEGFEYSINRCYTMYMQQNNDVLFNLLDSHDTERLINR